MSRSATHPYVVVAVGRHKCIRGQRWVGSAHKTLPPAAKVARRWFDRMDFIVGEWLPLWEWQVIDDRTGEVLWRR